ncbi:MAG TPA: ParB N-terminal domain-containing protein [Terriglobales bacterium]|nr:ParB N-terminal domain-containing protein [Terriglobales bacterium]
MSSVTSVSWALEQISKCEQLQTRAGQTQEAVTVYQERIQAGDQFPPLRIFRVENAYLLVDGFHRLAAYLAAGVKQVPVEITDGTCQEAIRFALGANAHHGLPRTNEDKRKAVELALAEFPDLSDRGVADICAVSDKLVAAVRKPAGEDRQALRVGRDGKHYPAERKPKAASQANEVPSTPEATTLDDESPDDGQSDATPTAPRRGEETAADFSHQLAQIRQLIKQCIADHPDREQELRESLFEACGGSIRGASKEAE